MIFNPANYIIIYHYITITHAFNVTLNRNSPVHCIFEVAFLARVLKIHGFEYYHVREQNTKAPKMNIANT